MRFIFSVRLLIAGAILSSGSGAERTPSIASSCHSFRSCRPSALASAGTCKVSTLVLDKRDGLTPWYANTDRTIWAHFWTPLNENTPWCCAVVGHNKVWWIRPKPFPGVSFNEANRLLAEGQKGTEFLVSGRRLDASAPPLRFSVPAVYAQGRQASDLYFPTEGCWEVTAKSGASTLRFTTEARPHPPSP
jgi:hypothetical protein